MRTATKLDYIITEVDAFIKTIAPDTTRNSKKPNPAAGQPIIALTSAEQTQVIGLMRVNHTGEVCAQALYQGQALTARSPHIQLAMATAAVEEIDHLAWCEERLRELKGRVSVLNPLWYIASFSLGAFSGLIGDSFSLGFVAETERQVSRHLQRHLEIIPKTDKKTSAILNQMLEDEQQHANAAEQAGGVSLPGIIRKSMTLMSKAMTTLSFYL